MNIKEELTCKYCHEIYKDPITLACGETICKQHFYELTSNSSSNKFMCPLCNQEILNQDLNVNKFIQKMVETELHKFEIDSKYKQTIENLRKELEINNDFENDK